MFAESPSTNTRPHCCHLAADMAVMKPGGPVMVAVIGVAAQTLKKISGAYTDFLKGGLLL